MNCAERMEKKMNDKMTLQDFERYMKDIKRSYEYSEKLNDFLRENADDGYVFQPDCIDTAVNLLSFIFGDEAGWIEYFVFELEFGKRYEDGMVINQDGSNISLASTEDLYKFLTWEGEEK